MSTNQDGAAAIKTGYMVKLGQGKFGVRNWQTRYFVLDDKMLRWYATQGSSFVKNKIYAEEVLEVLPIGMQPCLQLRTPVKTYMLRCTTKEDRDAWLKAIASIAPRALKSASAVETPGADSGTAASSQTQPATRASRAGSVRQTRARTRSEAKVVVSRPPPTPAATAGGNVSDDESPEDDDEVHEDVKIAAIDQSRARRPTEIAREAPILSFASSEIPSSADESSIKEMNALKNLSLEDRPVAPPSDDVGVAERGRDRTVSVSALAHQAMAQRGAASGTAPAAGTTLSGGSPALADGHPSRFVTLVAFGADNAQQKELGEASKALQIACAKMGMEAEIIVAEEFQGDALAALLEEAKSSAGASAVFCGKVGEEAESAALRHLSAQRTLRTCAAEVVPPGLRDASAVGSIAEIPQAVLARLRDEWEKDVAEGVAGPPPGVVLERERKAQRAHEDSVRPAPGSRDEAEHKELADAIVRYATENDAPHPMMVCAPCGSGVSLSVALAASRLRESGCRVVCRFARRSALTRRVCGMLEGVALEAAAASSIDAARAGVAFMYEPETIREALMPLLEAAGAASDTPFVVLVDGVDTLRDATLFSATAWLPVRLPPNCRVVFTVQPGEIAESMLRLLRGLPGHEANIAMDDEVPPRAALRALAASGSDLCDAVRAAIRAARDPERAALAALACAREGLTASELCALCDGLSPASARALAASAAVAPLVRVTEADGFRLVQLRAWAAPHVRTVLGHADAADDADAAPAAAAAHDGPIALPQHAPARQETHRALLELFAAVPLSVSDEAGVSSRFARGILKDRRIPCRRALDEVPFQAVHGADPDTVQAALAFHGLVSDMLCSKAAQELITVWKAAFGSEEAMFQTYALVASQMLQEWEQSGAEGIPTDLIFLLDDACALYNYTGTASDDVSWLLRTLVSTRQRVFGDEHPSLFAGFKVRLV